MSRQAFRGRITIVSVALLCSVLALMVLWLGCTGT